MADEHSEELDRRVLKMLADDGNDLTKEMTIEFTLAANSEEIAHAMADACDEFDVESNVYFKGDSLEADELDEGEPLWKCVCQKQMIPDFDALQEMQKILAETASRFDSELEGWGTFGNASS